MTSTQVTPVADSSLAPAEGFVRMHFLLVADQDRSREFYRAPSGADVPSERDPVVVKVANGWLILNAGGGPTEDKPTISYEPDKTRADDLRHQAQRDARARAARRARPARARLNVDDAPRRALFASSCSGRMRWAPALRPRRSGSPCGSSVPMGASAGWRRSPATIRRQPPSARAGSGRYSAVPEATSRRLAGGRAWQRWTEPACTEGGSLSDIRKD